MATAFLLSAAESDSRRDPKALLDLEQMRDSARADRFGVHSIAASPGSADLVLFVETSAGGGAYFERVRRDPVFRAHREKAYVFCSTDRVVALVPGVYAGIDRHHHRPDWTRSSGYLGVKERPPLVFEQSAQPTRLFSFIGSGSAHPVRRAVLGIDSAQGQLVDSDLEPMPAELYAEAIRDSAFVLCPRGGGTATFRLFEAMMLGRVPVIVSDRWVAPEGPEWDRFSVRVAEAEVAAIPALLAERAGDAAAMGALARREWLDWFAPEVAFHRIVDWCLELDRSRSARAGWRRYRPYAQLLHPYDAARLVAKRLARYRGPRNETGGR